MDKAIDTNPVGIGEADTEGNVEDLIADMGGWDLGLFDSWDDES